MTRRLTYKYVLEQFSKENYNLLSNDYTNARTKLYFICPKGHLGSSSWGNWKQGKRCKQCAINERADKKRLSYSYIKQQFAKEGYTLLSEEYKNSGIKLTLLCSNKHKIDICWDAWYAGNRCKICADIGMMAEHNPNWRGGKSYEQYCPVWSDKEYKASIKQRDNYICQNPICFKKDDVIHIHHINYDKKDCQPNNLITLCRSCNVRANFDRGWHKDWYTTIITNSNNFKEELICVLQ